MKYFSLIIVLSFFAVASVTSCKKKSHNTPTPISSYSFTDSGNMYTFNTISFKSTAPKGCTYIWKFGDGATSNDSFPTHIYYNADSFAVTLIVNNDSAHATHNIVYISSTTQRMSGNYKHCKEGGKVQSTKWPIDFAGIFYGIDPSTFSFSISVSNEASISLADSVSHVYNVTKVLNRNDAIGTDHTITFTNTTSTEYVTYDFLSDNIYYGLVDTTTPGSYSIDAFMIR
jgi:hypothetical protein